MASALNSNSITLGIVGLVGLTLLLTAIALSFGMFQSRSLLKREFTSYFLSPIAYVVIVLFLLMTGYLFHITLDQLTASGPKGVEYPFQYILGDDRFWLVFLFIPPLLTMRSFAEESASGTLEMLMTVPLKDWQVVLCKYLACLAFFVFMWIPTVAYLPVLLDLHKPVFHEAFTLYSITFVGGLAAVVLALAACLLPLATFGRAASVVLALGGITAANWGGWMHYHHDNPSIFRITAGIDPMPAFSSYLGLFLAGAMFLALGMLVSSLVRSQMVAALVSLFLGLIFIVAGFWRPDLDPGSLTYQVIQFISVPLHFQRDFTRGIVDSRHVILYCSVAVFCLFLTVRSLESRRWR